jgi:hypothetical protein
MPARKRWDLQIFWVVVLSLGFWAAIFWHEEAGRIAERVWQIGREIVASLSR